jgi:hypothetical protein
VKRAPGITEAGHVGSGNGVSKRTSVNSEPLR